MPHQMAKLAGQQEVVHASVRAIAVSRVDLAGSLKIQVHESLADVLDVWNALAAEGSSSVYQQSEWAKIALSSLEREQNATPFIVTGSMEGRPAFLFALAKAGRIFRHVRFIGGSHVNFNMGLFSTELLGLLRQGDMEKILSRIASLASDCMMLRLCCMPVQWNGLANPLTAIAHQPAINPGFLMDLSGGFEGVLKLVNGKRKRKKFRQQCRDAELAGGYRMIVANDPDSVSRLLNQFFDQKAARLRDFGITDSFSSPGAREMLMLLALGSIGTSEPLLRLHALEIGGKIRSVFGGGVKAKHFSGYFSSIANDEITSISPGEMLLYMLVEHYCALGFKSMDLGGGDERYKRSWCNEKVEMFDVIIAARASAIPIAALARFSLRARRFMRQTPLVWSGVSKIRQLRAALFWR